MVTTIDGSQGEGGGQILRNAMTYAALLQKSLEVHSIRAGRSQPGLRPQHLTGIRLCAEICGGRLVGDEVGSTCVRYEAPCSCSAAGGSKRRQRNIVGDTKTAGSVCLLLQAGLPCALFARTADNNGPAFSISLELRGGTNAAMAPQIEYLTEIFLPVARAGFGQPSGVAVDVERRGYFPKGGGVVKVAVPHMQSKKLKPISLLDRGQVLEEIKVRAFHAGSCPRWVAESMAEAAVKEFNTTDIGGRRLKPRLEIVEDPSAIDAASGILIVAKTSTSCIFGGSALGSRREKPNQTGKTAAKEIISALQSGGCVDGWLQDQVILYMALADGLSEIIIGCLTLHTQTAIDIAEQMTGAKFEVKPLDTVEGTMNNSEEQGNIYGARGLVEGRHLILCEGIGYTGG